MKKTPPAALGMLLIQTGRNNDFNISSYSITNNDNGNMVSSTQRKRISKKLPRHKNLTILPQYLPPSATGTHITVSSPIQHGRTRRSPERYIKSDPETRNSPAIYSTSTATAFTSVPQCNTEMNICGKGLLRLITSQSKTSSQSVPEFILN
ncbi:Uncharacterised protein [Salmonella enterica]|nr:Uncharacterised protein [Salmonella enterica]SUF49775.1 Uncharacterised protein [Salmonella enterica]